MAIRTYQDLQEIAGSETQRMEFVRAMIDSHKSTRLYREAVIAEQYCRRRNVTITEYQKLLYTVTGEAVPDNFSADYKMCSGFFQRFVKQEVQTLLGNGMTWQDPATVGRLGDDFQSRLQDAAHSALVGGVSFGFWNFDHMEVFEIQEFAPIYDEENGAMRAGIRFWQVSSDKPLKATLYEEDGYTDYLWNWDGETERGAILHEKRPYKIKVTATEVDDEKIYAGENYPTFPIAPLWGNKHRQSELAGLREQIDCYDLIKSGYANTIDEASMVYWAISGAGGMDDVDLAEFLDRVRRVHAGVTELDGAKAEPHVLDAPYDGRDALLDRLSRDLYRDAMALDTESISSGAVTATQIRAAYEPLNEKLNDFEYCVREFLRDILATAGIDDAPAFTRSMLVNTQEEIQTILQAAQYLSEDYVTRKILSLLGDADQAQGMIEQMAADELERIGDADDEDGPDEGGDEGPAGDGDA